MAMLLKIRCFVAVAEQGSFTAAAKVLHLSQPALGAHIRDLEQRYQIALFKRHTRGTSLSPAGEALLPRAQALLTEAERTEAALRAMRGAQPMRLLLGLTPTSQATLAPDLLQSCAAERPNIELVLEQGLSDDLRRRVEAGSLDAALCYMPYGGAQDGLLPLYTEDLYLIGRAGALGPRESVTFAELHNYPLTLERRDALFRRLLEEVAEAEGIRLDVRHEVEPVNVKRALIRRHGDFTVVPYGLFLNELHGGEMQAWPIVEPELSLTLYLARRQGLADDILAALSDWLRESVRGIIATGKLRWRSAR